MWIVKLALRRPYTFVVLSLLIFLLGIGSAIEAPKDIFPYIDIPVVTIVWTYTGLPPDEMEGRIVTVCERALTTTVNDIEHTESESYQGVSVIKVFFQPSVKVELAISQVTSIVQTVLRVLPPGTFPPAIVKYDASSVPILQLGLSGQGLDEEELYDLGLSFIRPRLATVRGASVPLPYGGKVRQVMVDTDPNAMYARHVSAADISVALSQQNLIIPAGTARMGDREYIVKTNSSPTEVSAFNDLPIRASNGSIVFMKDVAQVRNGYAVQTNIVRQDGKRSALLTILTNGQTSPACEGRLAAFVEDCAVVRPIHLRPRLDFRGRSRSCYCRSAHRSDDPALSWQLAVHAHRLHFHTPLHCHIARHSHRSGPDDQCHDAGGAGACRRHSG
jgi:multidrug efflux pump subunit AcrB